MKRQDVSKLQFEATLCLNKVVSGENEQVKALLEYSIAEAYIKLLTTPHLEVIEEAIWVLADLAGENPTVRDVVIAAGAVESIVNLLD